MTNRLVECMKGYSGSNGVVTNVWESIDQNYVTQNFKHFDSFKSELYIKPFNLQQINFKVLSIDNIGIESIEIQIK